MERSEAYLHPSQSTPLVKDSELHYRVALIKALVELAMLTDEEKRQVLTTLKEWAEGELAHLAKKR